jgi:hypothetical protein
MMAANTFTEAVQLQTQIMLNVARRLDEKGYAVILYNLNRDGENERYLYNYLGGALPRLLDDWARYKWGSGPLAKRRRPVIVHIHPDPIHWEAVLSTGKVMEHPFTFTCSIPNRVHYREIHATLELMSSKRKHRWRGEAQGTGVLVRVGKMRTTEKESASDSLEYRGSTKDALEVLLRVLEMPQHRKILLGQ